MAILLLLLKLTFAGEIQTLEEAEQLVEKAKMDFEESKSDIHFEEIEKALTILEREAKEKDLTNALDIFGNLLKRQ